MIVFSVRNNLHGQKSTLCAKMHLRIFGSIPVRLCCQIFTFRPLGREFVTKIGETKKPIL